MAQYQKIIEINGGQAMWVPQQEQKQKQVQNVVKNTAPPTVFSAPLPQSDPVKQHNITEKVPNNKADWQKMMLFSDDINANAQEFVPQKIQVAKQTPITAPNDNAHNKQHATARKAQSKAQPAVGVTQRRNKYRYLPAKIIFFAGLYLCGALCAGWIYPLLQNASGKYTSYYLDYFFLSASDGAMGTMLCNNFSAAFFSLTLIFLVGLSAFGLPVISLFLCCKGAGSAFLLLYAFTQYQWAGAIYYLLLFGISDALLAVFCCVMAVHASQSAFAIFKYTFTTQQIQPPAFLRCFLRQYLLLLLVMAVVCLLFALAASPLSAYFSHVITV